MVRLAIQRRVDGMCMDVTIKKNSKVKTFQDLLSRTTVGEKKLFISPTILFSLLTALNNFHNVIEENFSFELTSELTSLFKQGMMGKSTKAIPWNHFIEIENVVTLDVIDNCIIAGGMVLYKLYWSKSTFSDVLDQYISYLWRRCATYKQCHMYLMVTVMMRHLNRRTTKRELERHLQLLQWKGPPESQAERKCFLWNLSNKNQLIQLLCKRLENEGYFAVQS